MAMPEIAGVIGDPVSHSLSPVLHHAAYEALGIDWTYLAFRVREGDVKACLVGARALGLKGLSVTMPHKQAAALWADQRSLEVELLGAANTISIRSGILIASNTDGAGMLADLEEGGFDPLAKSCAVIGAGGAARAAVLALFRAGASEVLVFNRDAERARAAASLAKSIGQGFGLEDLARIADCALVVQATPMGMASTGEIGANSSASIGALLGAGQVALDMVYAPAITPFLRQATSNGATTRGGLGMLVCQAALQVEAWTGLKAPREVMAKAGREALRGT